MLLKTGIELALISDKNLLDKVETSKRGGYTFVGTERYFKANNKYLNDYDENIESKYGLYVDANNLYGLAICQHLPYSDIKSTNDILIDDVLNTPDDSDIGYMVELDLSFPKEIHELLTQFVPCPENLKPTKEWFNEYQQEVQALTKATTNTTTLVAHLYDRKNYTLHYRNLKCLLTLKVKVNNKEHGILITHTHNIISFKQSACMKPYIEGNNDLRKEAKHEFETDFLKLMHNSVFGKTMENVKHRIGLRLTTDPNMAIKQFSMLNFKTAKHLDGLYMVEQYKTKVVMSKPIYVGCASLDLSKVTMLELHYNVMENLLKIYILCLMVILIVLYILLNIQISMDVLKNTSNILICQSINEKICKMIQIRKS
jgi:hypothetical protein